MSEITYREAIISALDEELNRDAKVFLLGEDVGCLGGAMACSKGLLEKYGPKRIMDTPISESAIIGSALGAALTGLRPIAEIMFIDFMGVCLDQIINQVAKVTYMLGGQVKVPLVIRTQGGAGKSYAAQHSQSLEAWFAHIPGIKVVMPSNPADAKGLLKSAIREDAPVLYIEHKLLYNTKSEVPDNEYLTPLGVSDIKRKGTDVTVTAHSYMVLKALQAAEELMTEEGISVEVIDLRTISPLDIETVYRSVEKTGRLVSVEEAHQSFGIGAEVCSRVQENCFDYLDSPIKRVAAADCPIPCSHVLEKVVIPQVEDIKKIVLETVKGEKQWIV